MHKYFLIILAFLTISCSDPKDFIFSNEPLKQISDNPDIFKKLPEDERRLLAGYLAANELSGAFGSKKQIAGLSVSDVLTDAKAWQQRIQDNAAETLKRQKEADDLAQKVAAEQKEISEKIAAMISVAITEKTSLKRDFMKSRANDLLELKIAFENKQQKSIKQIKGYFDFFDPSNDFIGRLSIDMNQIIRPNEIIKENNSFLWNADSFTDDSARKIYALPTGGFTYSFTPVSIAFDDGEIIKIPSNLAE